MDLVLLYAVLYIGGFIMLIVWIVLPFAIIGTKPLLRDMIVGHRAQLEAQRALVTLLEQTNRLLLAQNGLLDQRLPALRRPTETAR